MQCFQQLFGSYSRHSQYNAVPERAPTQQVVLAETDADSTHMAAPAETTYLPDTTPADSPRQSIILDDQKLFETLAKPASALRRSRSMDDFLGHIHVGEYRTMTLESSESAHILHGRHWPATLQPEPLTFATEMTTSPHSQAKGVITLIHGMGEHSGCYHELAKSLNKQGYHVFAFDHRGHGLSQGQRGVLDHYDQLHQDVIDHLDYSRSQYPDLPHSVYAHSMGGGLMLDHLRQYEAAPHLSNLEKIVVSNPWIKLQNPLTPIIDLIAWVLQQLRWDIVHDVAAGIPANPDRDPVSDPLCHANISTKWYSGAQAAAAKTMRAAKEYPQHFLNKLVLLHSANDKVTNPQATQRFATQSNTPFVDMKNLSHSPHMTRNKATYFDILAQHFEK